MYYFEALDEATQKAIKSGVISFSHQEVELRDVVVDRVYKNVLSEISHDSKTGGSGITAKVTPDIHWDLLQGCLESRASYVDYSAK